MSPSKEFSIYLNSSTFIFIARYGNIPNNFILYVLTNKNNVEAAVVKIFYFTLPYAVFFAIHVVIKIIKEKHLLKHLTLYLTVGNRKS